MMLKDSVRLGGLLPQTLLGVLIAESVFLRVANVGAVITSANDDIHGGRGIAGETQDPHYTGRAVDLRMKHVDVKQRATLIEALGAALGVEYDLLWENKGTEREHAHLQYTGKA